MYIVIKAPNEVATKIEFNGNISLRTLQEAVGGYIELVGVSIGGSKFDMYVNEEGLINDLPYNEAASKICNMDIVGTVVFCKTCGEDCVPLAEDEANVIIRGLG